MTPNPKDDLEWDDLCQEDQDFIESVTKFAENNEMDANTIIARIESIRETQRQQMAQKILRRLSFRQQKINALWISTKLKEYEYAKMVLQEEIEYIKKRLGQ